MVGVPVVASANRGYKLVAVAVSLLSAAPDITVAHVPSPLQYVVADALVPLFKLVTGKLPVTWVAKSTLLSVPPNVMVPVVVMVPPVRVIPLTVPAVPTDVTVPEPPDGKEGGESCRSSNDVWLMPPPVK